MAVIKEFWKSEALFTKKEVDTQDTLLSICSDLLLEARYPSAVSSTNIDRVIKRLQRLRKQI